METNVVTACPEAFANAEKAVETWEIDELTLVSNRAEMLPSQAEAAERVADRAEVVCRRDASETRQGVVSGEIKHNKRVNMVEKREEGFNAFRHTESYRQRARTSARRAGSFGD